MVLSACGDCFELALGKQLHEEFLLLSNSNNKPLKENVFISTALIYMYSKTDNLSEAEDIWNSLVSSRLQQRKQFPSLPQQELVPAWTSMIGGYAEHGFAVKALDLFHEWNSVLQPNSITFTNVLTACSHGGLVEEAFNALQLMKESFSIEPKLIHHTCFFGCVGKSQSLARGQTLL
jgi:pentatricopeptide repeat protein